MSELSDRLVAQHEANERFVDEAQTGSAQDIAEAKGRARKKAAAKKAADDAKKKVAENERVGTGRALTAGTNKVATDMIDRQITAATASNNAELVKVLKERRKQVLAGS